MAGQQTATELALCGGLTMDKYTETEQAYKNGAEKTKKKILELLSRRLMYANGLERSLIKELMEEVSKLK